MSSFDIAWDDRPGMFHVDHPLLLLISSDEKYSNDHSLLIRWWSIDHAMRPYQIGPSSGMLGLQLLGAPADAIILMLQVVLMGDPAGVTDAFPVHPYASALAREAEQPLILYCGALHIGGTARAIALFLKYDSSFNSTSDVSVFEVDLTVFSEISII